MNHQAELLCRKLMEQRNDWYGRNVEDAVEDKLLLAKISSAQVTGDSWSYFLVLVL
jgi:hypothetical protein